VSSSKSEEGPAPRRARWLGLAAFVLLLSAAIIIPFMLWDDILEPVASAKLEQATEEVRGLVVIGLLTADIVLPIPSSLVMVGAAMALPTLTAFLSCFVGLLLGCSVGYAMGWVLGEPLLAHMADPERRAMLSAWFTRHGVIVVAVCRPIPVLAELSIVMAGSARSPLPPFVLGCAAANAGVAGVYVALGSQVSDTWTFLAAFAASCLLPALGWLMLHGLARLRAWDSS
jgi:membrane protein DedA with SNARE-associated domain